MVFSSIIFLFLFLPMLLFLYYLIPGIWYKNSCLLAASLLFYAWGEPQYVVVMIGSIMMNWFIGCLLGWSKNSHRYFLCKAFTWGGVFLNLFLLFYFKYLDFSIINFNKIFHTQISLRSIVMPIGISFFTFQGLTYLIDLYRGNVKTEKNPFVVGLYISLFPQLIAGPIVRYIDIKEQITQRVMNLDKFYYGIKRFIIGMAKKVLLANTVGEIADGIFSCDYGNLGILCAWLGILCYTFQIYYDFSGYSDMAIGLGSMFGFEFKENFNYPYISKSVREFWRRWHISLSSFFRDYLYIPLGGNRKHIYINLVIVFICTGLWHGASWNFILWGLWHGFFSILERILSKKSKFSFPLVVSWLYTAVVVIIGWVFFRVETMAEGFAYIQAMFIPSSSPLFDISYYLNPYTCLILILCFLFSVNFRTLKGVQFMSAVKCKMIGDLGIIVLFAICILNIMSATYNPFIYFRF